MAGPFVISLVHFNDNDEEEQESSKRKDKTKNKAKGKGKEKERAHADEPPAPSSMIGLIVNPLPQSGDKNGIYLITLACLIMILNGSFSSQYYFQSGILTNSVKW